MIEAFITTEEPSIAAAPAAQPLAGSFASLAAPLMSVAVHAVLALGAAHVTFHHAETTSARVDFRAGASREVRVQLRLVMAEPVVPVSSADRFQPPTMPEAPARPSQARPASAPTQPPDQPFEGVPSASRQPIDGASPGQAPPAAQSLPGEPGEIDRLLPELIPASLSGRSATAPASATTDAAPVDTNPRSVHSFAAAAAPSRADSTPDHLAGVPSFANPPAPVIDLSMPEPREVARTAPPPAPVAAISRAAADTAPAPAGVSTGIDIDRLVEPRYPEDSVRAREEGTVVLAIEVLPDGTVGRVRVLESPGFELLEKAAIDAVRRSRFKPAMRAGVAVRDVLRKPFVFRVTDRFGR